MWCVLLPQVIWWLEVPFPHAWLLPKPVQVRSAGFRAFPCSPSGGKLNASGPRHQGRRKTGLWLGTQKEPNSLLSDWNQPHLVKACPDFNVNHFVFALTNLKMKNLNSIQESDFRVLDGLLPDRLHFWGLGVKKGFVYL